MPWWVGLYIGSFALMALVMLSEGAQWLLKTIPFQFMGRISYMLYLIHELFIEWMMIDFYGHFRRRDKPLPTDITFEERSDLTDDKQIPHEMLVLYNWLIFTPILILVSWLLTWLVDDTAKNFAYELDVQCRVFKKKPAKPGEPEKEDEREPFWRFILMNWKIWALCGYFFVIITIAEIYNAVKGQPHRYKGEPREYK